MEEYQSQVGCMSYSNLEHNDAFKDQIEFFLSPQFDYKPSVQMRKKLKHYNIYVIAMIIFYENRKSSIFKLLGVTVYFFLEKYVCGDYLCLQK